MSLNLKKENADNSRITFRSKSFNLIVCVLLDDYNRRENERRLGRLLAVIRICRDPLQLHLLRSYR